MRSPGKARSRCSRHLIRRRRIGNRRRPTAQPPERIRRKSDPAAGLAGEKVLEPDLHPGFPGPRHRVGKPAGRFRRTGYAAFVRAGRPASRRVRSGQLPGRRGDPQVAADPLRRTTPLPGPPATPERTRPEAARAAGGANTPGPGAGQRGPVVRRDRNEPGPKAPGTPYRKARAAGVPRRPGRSWNAARVGRRSPPAGLPARSPSRPARTRPGGGGRGERRRPAWK